MYGVIYMIVNLLNGMRYVGQTRQPLKKRMYQHAKANSYIGNAIRHYGWKNFTVEVIEECETLEQLNEREKFWIAYFNCKHPNGYNLTDGGDGIASCTQETRDKISAAKTGKKLSDETRANMSAERAERYKNPEALEVLSVAQKKRWAEHPVTEETLAKRSQTAMRHYEEHPEKRVVASEQMIARWAAPAEHERMSALMKEIYSDPERLAKQSEASKKYRAEHPYTDGERARISDSVKRYHAEHPESEQTRAKKSLAQKKRHAKKRAVRGLLATLLVARRQADTSPEMSVTLIRATVEIFSRFADSQRVQ